MPPPSPSAPLKRVLVANRGEIAMRIVHAAKALGMEAVGVHSAVDRHLPHLELCDATVEIGPAPAAQSYLVIDKLLAAAKDTGCDCVHPGYGFLAESALFARAVVAAGLVWVGPHAEAIEQMGDKIGSKALMKAAGVPIINGFTVDLTDKDRMVAEADHVGFPLLVKPTAGGGGKGMYVVRSTDELLGALEKSEHDAAQAFGRGGLLVERFLATPKHIEVQVLGDKHGGAVHLFERECSIQRRHQKLIEEAPAPGIDEATRQRICAAGVEAARACGYDSAGTVEGLYDAATGEYFFLEMNTRLQVEHPVSEMITGVDICQAMFRVAAGEPLWFAQDQVRREGHAIECRIIAEDPFANFAPSFGPLTLFDPPAAGENVRVDSGFRTGIEVSHHYDSLLAKLITHGTNRGEAIERMQAALAEFAILGVQTCIPFHQAMLVEAAFVDGSFDVHTCERLLKDGLMTKDAEITTPAVALAAALLHISETESITANSGASGAGAWIAPEGTRWRMAARPWGAR